MQCKQCMTKHPVYLSADGHGDECGSTGRDPGSDPAFPSRMPTVCRWNHGSDRRRASGRSTLGHVWVDGADPRHGEPTVVKANRCRHVGGSGGDAGRGAFSVTLIASHRAASIDPMMVPGEKQALLCIRLASVRLRFAIDIQHPRA